MITGFNTDISYGGTTYHVQTEDKGTANPIILSLVYVRGAILAAKRTSYAKELERGMSEEQLQTMLEKQHRTILAVIKAGRIQELVEKLSKQRTTDGSPAETDEPLPKEDSPTFPVPPPLPIPVAPPSIPTVPVVEASPLPPVGFDVTAVSSPVVDSPVVSAPLSSPNIGYRQTGSLEMGRKGDTQPLFAEFDLDKIIFDYLQTDAQEEKLEIRLRGGTEFYAGDSILLQIEVSLGGIRPQPNLPVIVKVIGTAFKPQIYSGRTGSDGIAIIPVTLPNFTAGSAAIVIQSSSEVGEAESKQLIRRR